MERLVILTLESTSPSLTELGRFCSGLTFPFAVSSIMYLLPSWWLITFLLCAIVLLGSTREGGLEYSMRASTSQSEMGTLKHSLSSVKPAKEKTTS